MFNYNYMTDIVMVYFKVLTTKQGKHIVLKNMYTNCLKKAKRIIVETVYYPTKLNAIFEHKDTINLNKQRNHLFIHLSQLT